MTTKPMIKTLTKAILTQRLSQTLGFSKVETQAFIESFFDKIAENLEAGKMVKLSRFGNFVLLDKGDRMGRNPKTGAQVLIEKRRVLTFRPGNKLRKRIEQGGINDTPNEEQIASTQISQKEFIDG